MRVRPSYVALVLLFVLPGAAEAARDWWEGAGAGESQISGEGACAAVFQAGLERQSGNSWWMHLEVYAYPNRFEIFGCLPRGYVFPSVQGSPTGGWRSTVQTPCAIQHIEIGPIGNLAAGASELYYYVGDYCNGDIEWGRAAMAFATPDG